MANAKKKRDRKFPQTEFEISITDAVSQLLRPRDVLPTDKWSFFVDGETLKITRIRAVEEIPLDPEDL